MDIILSDKLCNFTLAIMYYST